MATLRLPDRDRVDARDKVLGRTQYAADVPLPRLLHAMLVPATIAKGRITAIETSAALAVPGVVRILGAKDFPPAPPPARFPEPDIPHTLIDEVRYRGQAVALVVAETLEAAIEGAQAVKPTYSPQPFASTKDSPLAERQPGRAERHGDADAALATASTVVRAVYKSPTQHHNPIELVSTTANWSNGHLTIYEGTQHSGGIRAVLARILQLDPAAITVTSAYVGGAFGQKGWVAPHTAIAARAAMLIGRPVKLVVPRGQIFHTVKFRPESSHSLGLGSDGSGRITALRYDTDHQNSRSGSFLANYFHNVMRLYPAENLLGLPTEIRIDTQSPGHMRAPHEHPGCFALESAVDELAYELRRDPVELRLANDTDKDPLSGKPFSSRHLAECLRRGAERFGWSRRTAEPGSMRLADGTLVGMGVASGVYPTSTSASVATLRIGADGSTYFATTGHEMGQGIRSAIANVLIEALGAEPSKLTIGIGDTSLAPQHVTVGSWGTFSAVPIALQAVERMRAAVAELAGGRRLNGRLHRQLATLRRPYLQVEVTHLGPGQNPAALDAMRRGNYAISGSDFPEFVGMSFSAHFVEVHVEPSTGRVRVPRSVSVADCGRVISPRTAGNQLRGGIVWAIGATLREASEVDPCFGGFLNSDLADYVVPVNADVGDVDISFINEPDPKLNSLGLKGLGEVSLAGAAAAIANAVYHATGRRIRSLPIRIEDLI